MTKDEYKEKLADPRWQSKRLEVFERDAKTCQNCGYAPSPYQANPLRGLQAHHNWYERGRDPWDYPLEALITLCWDCHEAETLYRLEMERDLLDSLRKSRFLGSDLMRLRGQIEKTGPSLPRYDHPRGYTEDQRYVERERRRIEIANESLMDEPEYEGWKGYS